MQHASCAVNGEASSPANVVIWRQLFDSLQSKSLGLKLHQLVLGTMQFGQFLLRAFLGDFTVVDNDKPVSVAQG